jgi:hypothetical protein
LVAVLAVAVSDADARAGRGGSFGSRGSQDVLCAAIDRNVAERATD